MCKNKITNVLMRIDDTFVSTGMNITSVPTTQIANVSLELFNINLETSYSFKISANDNTVFFSSVSIQEDTVLFKTENGGKINLSFPISLIIESAGDMVITFELWDKVNNQILDTYHKYVCFEVKDND